MYESRFSEAKLALFETNTTVFKVTVHLHYMHLQSWIIFQKNICVHLKKEGHIHLGIPLNIHLSTFWVQYPFKYFLWCKIVVSDDQVYDGSK